MPLTPHKPSTGQGDGEPDRPGGLPLPRCQRRDLRGAVAWLRGRSSHGQTKQRRGTLEQGRKPAQSGELPAGIAHAPGPEASTTIGCRSPPTGVPGAGGPGFDASPTQIPMKPVRRRSRRRNLPRPRRGTQQARRRRQRMEGSIGSRGSAEQAHACKRMEVSWRR